LWSTLETATLGLANHTKGSAYEDEIRNEIMQIKTWYITSIRDILRQWYSDHILELKDEVDTLKQKIDKIETHTAKTEMILNKASRKRKRHDGTCYKWLNPTPALEKMRSKLVNFVCLSISQYIHKYICNKMKMLNLFILQGKQTMFMYMLYNNKLYQVRIDINAIPVFLTFENFARH
jgi:hypothetical protein